MELIDRRGKQKQEEQQIIINKAVEHDELVIQVYPDSKIYGELRILKEDHSRWINGTPQGRTLFLQTAIKNRSTLDAFVIENYDKANAKGIAAQHMLTCTVDEETLAELKDEARSMRLNLDEYMRALTYTYAKKIRDEKIQRDNEAEAKRIAMIPLVIEVPLLKPLQAALIERYPFTEEEKIGISLATQMRYSYMKERLLKVIEESLGE